MEVEYREYLVSEQEVQPFGGSAEVVTDGKAVHARQAEVSRKEEFATQTHDFVEFLNRWHAPVVGAVVAHRALGVVAGELLHDIGNDMGMRGHVGKVRCCLKRQR